jgi:multiple sugar transport system permease protein
MSGIQTNRRTTRVLLWAALTMALIVYGFPFLYLILTSFKTPQNTIAVPPSLVPSPWTLENYVIALAEEGVTRSILNSVLTAAISTVLSMILAVPAAYAITRYRTRIGQYFVIVVLITRMVPAIVVGAPLISTMSSLGISDTQLGLALAHTTISLPLSIWLMASFFEVVPNELEEAAKMDGASRLRALRWVILPIVSGGLAVTAIFAFLASWNEFLFALLLTSINAQTTPIVIANFQTQFGLDWGSMTALSTLYSVPVILLTLALQRHIVAGLTLGAIKG